MAHKTSDVQARKQALQKKVLEFLAKSGNVTAACKQAGISRETYYTWREERPFAYEADEALIRGDWLLNDVAINGLIHKLRESDMQAIRFQLSSRHPNYYQPRRPKPWEDFIPLAKIDVEVATPQNMREMLGEETYKNTLGYHLEDGKLESLHHEKKPPDQKHQET